MPNLNIKTTHKPIKTYYTELEKYAQLGEKNEGTVRAAFQNLLQHYCSQANLTLLCEKSHYTPQKRRIIPDGEVVDGFGLPHGYWEAKDTQDDLHVEADKKFAAGYPSKNIVVQSPTHALLYQHGQLQLDLDITHPKNLVHVLETFFAYQEENIAAWHTAVAEFREIVPELGEKLAVLIETERQNNPHFQKVFTNFHEQCQASINPNLSVAAVEEMLIQHLLTERIFATVFDNRDFTRRNIIAREIENVVDALTERTLNRSEFLRPLNPFYVAIEQTASTITDFSQKQGFLNNVLTENMSKMIANYSAEVARWEQRIDRDVNLDDFVIADDAMIKWSSTLKQHLKRGQITAFVETKIRQSLYRPFTKLNLYFDRMMVDRVLVFPSIFPSLETETQNRVIIVSDHGFRAGFNALMTNLIPDVHTISSRDSFQCFPFYTYDEDGTNRRENITMHYADDTITKWDIFHYNYGLLHHPEYREKYEANLKRDLPHIPFAKDFWRFSKAGAHLADLHVNYESQSEYNLQFVQTPDTPLDWRVEKMKLSKDKTQIVYNNFLTLDGIPPKAFDYRLGTRSALEWVIDQYCVKTDKRSGIVNDPNRPDDPQYIVQLIGKVITVSLETVGIVDGLTALEIA